MCDGVAGEEISIQCHTWQRWRSEKNFLIIFFILGIHSEKLTRWSCWQKQHPTSTSEAVGVHSSTLLFFCAYTYIVVSFHPSASPTSIIRNKCSFSAISIGCNFHYFIVFLLSFLHRSPFAHTPSRWSAMELWNNIKIYVLAYEFCISS